METDTCGLTPVSLLVGDADREGDVSENMNVEFERPFFSALNGGALRESETDSGKNDPSGPGNHGNTAVVTSDSESGIFSGELELCVEHETELDWFCSSEQKLICSHCAILGPCQGHTVKPLTSRVTAVRNKLVDVCEKMQLQALGIERFINQTLLDKERSLQSEASLARELILSRCLAVREALDQEEQRLLEEVQRGEERAEQGLLTQRAHWGRALGTLARAREGLVNTLTTATDAQLATAGQEIAERAEEAEGVGAPCDSEQLSLNPGCSDSKLMTSLWGGAILLGPAAYRMANLTFNERTVSPLLSLSDDLRTLTFLPRRLRPQSAPYDPARFDGWPNALGSRPVSAGTHGWVLDVGRSSAFKVGVAYGGVARKGGGSEARLGHNAQSWVLSHYEGEYAFCHAGRSEALPLARRPGKVGVVVDWPGRTLLWYEPDSCAVLHTHALTHAFTAPLLPAFAVADQSVTLLNCL